METKNSKFFLLIFIISFFIALSSSLKLKISQIKKSTEEGFMGDPKTFFNYTDFFSKTSPLNHKKLETDDPSQMHYGGWVLQDGMLKDKRRTLTIKEAIFKNSEVFKDKIVLEIGAGSGVLSLFAAQAGAKHVYAFEFSDFAEAAMKNVEDNGLSDKVTIIKKKAEEGELPVDKVDIIISEWMDSFLFGENMISAVFYARDKWLKKDGLILPDRGAIKLAAIHSQRLLNFVDFYDDVYGLKMPVIKQIMKSNSLYMELEPEEVISSVDTIYEFDMYKMKPKDVNFASSYSLKINEDTQVTALASWWFVEFNLPNKVVLSTDPKAGQSIWKQDVLYLETPIKIAKGEKLNGSISIAVTDDLFKRSNQIKISFHYNGNYGAYNKIQQYICDGSSML